MKKTKASLILKISSIVFLLVGSSALWATESCQSGGRVNFLLGDGTTFKLTRSDKAIKAKAYIPLCAGDRLEVTSDKSKASLQLGRNRFEMLQGPVIYEVPAAEGAPGKEYGLLKVASEMILKQDFRMSRRAQSRAANDLTVNFPCLSADSKCALLAASKRPVGMQWSGGTAPFKVKLTDCGIKKLYKETTSASFFQTPSVDLVTGQHYCISVKDAKGVKRRVQFTAKAIQELPKTPDLSGDEWLTQEQKATLYAIHLLMSGPEWAFEAYQHLIPFVDSHPPADTLARGLAKGELKIQ